MNINVIETNTNVEPESNSIIVTVDYDYHLILNKESIGSGFHIYDLYNDERFSYDSYEEYLDETNVKEIFKSNEITITLKKEVEQYGN